ncbi:hypothetical protein D3C71_1756740 [compost metagenome]
MGAVSTQQVAAFQGHGFRHNQNGLVALGCGHHGQADAGIARSRFHNSITGLQLAFLLGNLHHADGNPILYAGAGVLVFQLHIDFRTVFGNNPV